MFDQFARTPSRKSVSPKGDLTITTAFVSAVVSEGLRLSYGALAASAKALGENDSNQILAQRGAGLVKSLPLALQPFICRKAGGYAKGVVAAFGDLAPKDLVDRPVIVTNDAVQAAEAWVESVKASADADQA